MSMVGSLPLTDRNVFEEDEHRERDRLMSEAGASVRAQVRIGAPIGCGCETRMCPSPAGGSRSKTALALLRMTGVRTPRNGIADFM